MHAKSTYGISIDVTNFAQRSLEHIHHLHLGYILFTSYVSFVLRDTLGRNREPLLQRFLFERRQMYLSSTASNQLLSLGRFCVWKRD